MRKIPTGYKTVTIKVMRGENKMLTIIRVSSPVFTVINMKTNLAEYYRKVVCRKEQVDIGLI